MLTLRVSGKKDQLQAFMNHFSAQPCYKIIMDEQKGTATIEEEITTQFEFLTYKPKPNKQNSLTVTLLTMDDKEIAIDILDGRIIQINEKVTCVHGKNYDIFA